MKKISIAILTLLVVLSACKKVPEVNLKYVDVERDLITVGTTSATVQCDYRYIATLKKAYFYYCEGKNEADMNSAEMRVVQNTLYVDLAGLKENTTYSYYYEFHNGFNSMRTVAKTFKTESSPVGVIMPTVVTATVTEITTNSAKGGGEVTNDGSAEVTERGICWSTNANPDLSDSHVAVGAGLGAFNAAMSGLEANTTYHVRAYAINSAGTAYGLDREFVTLSGGNSGNQEYVDLCLPSGTLWATCNIGANTPEEYGNYFSWGEIEPKSLYEWSTYKYCSGDSCTLTKYCNNSEYGYNGYTDNLTTLLAEDDAATVNLGPDWCTPTLEQWLELLDNTTSCWTTQNGVNGWLFTASCGNSLFLPAAGFRNRSDLCNVGNCGYYWSSPIDTIYPLNALNFSINSGGYGMVSNVRLHGQSIRAVRTIEGCSLGVENVINGDFEQGNLGFISEYAYDDGVVLYEGMYNVDYDAHMHHPDFVGVGHGSSGKFMIINGAMASEIKVWTEQISVEPNTCYVFSAWICTLVEESEALLQFSINDIQIGDVFTAPAQTNNWQQFYVSWYSGNSTTATITILNRNTAGMGNDFGLDDISFRELLTP